MAKQYCYNKKGMCILCNKEFIKHSPTHKWCDECKQEKVKCPTCKKMFTRNFPEQKYCSDSCCGRNRTKKPVKKVCPKCGVVFVVKDNSQRKKQKYCSPKCARRGGRKRGKEITCDGCGKMFYCPPNRLTSKNHFCSRPCYSKFQKNKPKEYTWSTKKGKAKTRRAFDSIWRKKALKAADGKCEICDTTKNLNVHHALSRGNYSTRWYLPNSVVLCVKHHMWDRDLSAHGNPIEFAKWILEKRGIQWWEDLKRQKNEIWHNWKTKINEIKEHLEGNREDYL